MSTITGGIAAYNQVSAPKFQGTTTAQRFSAQQPVKNEGKPIDGQARKNEFFTLSTLAIGALACCCLLPVAIVGVGGYLAYSAVSGSMGWLGSIASGVGSLFGGGK